MVTLVDSVVLRSAADLPIRLLTQVLNHAYADYFIPVWFNRYQFEQMCDDMDVDLGRSVVAMANGKPVGLALLSLRRDEGWVSGVGVIPAWRRQGVGRAIMRRLQETAQHETLTRLRLEVLHENKGGRHLYDEIGFTWDRDLLVLRLTSKPQRPPDDSLRLLQSQPVALLRHHLDFHLVEPSWQNELPSLRKRADRVDGLGLWMDNSLVGYVLYQAQSDVCHVLDLAVDPALDGRVDLARTMLLSLHNRYPGLGGYIINLPAEDPLLAAFTDVGYSIWHRQGEMVWRVPHEHRPPEA